MGGGQIAHGFRVGGGGAGNLISVSTDSKGWAEEIFHFW